MISNSNLTESDLRKINSIGEQAKSSMEFIMTVSIIELSTVLDDNFREIQKKIIRTSNDFRNDKRRNYKRSK